MFIFGIAYAVASIGCTIGFLTTAIFGSIGFKRVCVWSTEHRAVWRRHGASREHAYSHTCCGSRWTLASVRKRIALHGTNLLLGFIVLTGMYLTWYWYVAVSERSTAGNVTQNVEGWQSSVATFLQRQGSWRLGFVFFVVVGGAILVNQLRTRKR